jgi:hypothetical protein
LDTITDLLQGMAGQTLDNLLVSPEGVHAYARMAEAALACVDDWEGWPHAMIRLGHIRREALNASTPALARRLAGLHADFKLIGNRFAGAPLRGGPSPCWCPVTVYGAVGCLRGRLPDELLHLACDTICDRGLVGVLCDWVQDHDIGFNHPLLEHLRGPGPHSDGCWAVAVMQTLGEWSAHCRTR